MSVPEQSAGLSIFSQSSNGHFMRHSILDINFWPQNTTHIELLAHKNIKHLGWAILISLDIDIPYLQIAPLVGNLKVGISHSLFLKSSI